MKNMRRCVIWCLVLFMITCCVPSIVLAEETLESEEEADPAGAAACIRGSVSGVVRYDLIFSFLDELNAYRSSIGAGTVIADASLTELALQRAAEQIVFCGHERPDGSGVFSGNLFQGYCGGEICWLLDNGACAHDILVGFKNRPGHDSVMRDKAYSAAGIGIVETAEGALGVVVNFRNGGTAMARRSDHVPGKWSFNVLPQFFVPAIAPEQILYSTVPTEITIYGRNTVYASTNKMYCYDIDQSSLTSITSLTPETAAVTDKNKLAIKSAGNITLEIKAGGKTFSTSSKIRKGTLSADTVTGISEGAKWNGSGFDVPPRFIYNENGSMKELVKDTDYTLKKAEQLESGEIRCFIMGIGSFTGFGYITLKAEDTYVTPDVCDPNAWYYVPVKWAAENDYINPNENFYPDDACTRAMAVYYLYELAGKPDVAFEPIFSDVHGDEWYAKAVIWAVKNGVTTGYGAGKFAPDVPCNRAIIVGLLMKYYRFAHPGWQNDLSFNDSFSDVKSSDWYANPVTWAVENGITSGFGAGIFKPYSNCSKAMIISFIRKMDMLP